MPGITNPAEAFFKDGIWGWDGSAWRKLPLVWGYSEHWAEAVSDLNAGAGDDSVTTTAVPAGYVHVLQAVGARWTGASCTRILISVNDGTNDIILKHIAPPTSGQWETLLVNIVLTKGDKLIAAFAGLTAGDDLNVQGWGYKMKIAE